MASTFQVIVVTPETTALDQAVDFVAIPAIDGELGVMANHAPLIARLGCGELRLQSGSHTERLYVDGGFAQIAGNVVSVLTGQALKVSEIDVAKVQAALHAAESQRVDNPVEEELRRRTVAQARAQLRVAGHSGNRAAAAGH